MKKNPSSQSGLFNPRAFVAFTLCCVGTLLAAASFAAKPKPAPLTFGHPIISGIGGVGFEQGLRVDPSNASRLYTSVPGSLSSDTSWIWHSLDGGKTFKWVIDAIALEGKVTTCFGGRGRQLQPLVTPHPSMRRCIARLLKRAVGCQARHARSSDGSASSATGSLNSYFGPAYAWKQAR